MRRLPLVVGPVVFCACSIVESFDGYTGGGDDAAADGALGDAATDSFSTGDSRVDAIGDSLVDSAVVTDTTTPPPDVPVDTFPGPGDYLCVFGGTADASLTPRGEVWCSHLAGDGSPAGWIAQTPLPEPLSEAVALTDGTHVWIVGGRSASGFSATIYATSLGADGRLGAWSSIGSLPEGRRAHLAFAWRGDTLLVHGGEIAAGGVPQTLHASMSFASSTIGSWATETSSDAPARGAGVLFQNSVYVLDGEHGSTILDEADRYVLGGGSGSFGGAYNQSSGHLAPTRFDFGLALHASSTGTGDFPRVFALGGDDGGGARDDVTFSNFEDGVDTTTGATVPNVLTTWTTNASHLVHARSAHAVAQTLREHVFVVGGFVGAAPSAEVEQADVAGETLSFSLTLPLPAPRAFAVAAVVTL